MQNTPNSTSASKSNDHILTNKTFVIGKTGAGKSSFINFLLGTSLKVSPTMQRGTSKVTVVSKDILNVNLQIFDTPGLADISLDVETKNNLKSLLENVRKINCIVLCINSTETR